MSSIFTKIIAGDIPSHKIAETDEFLAFLDINPLHTGHTLVIPKKEVDYLFDLDETTYSGLWSFSKKVSDAIRSTIACERIGVAVIGLEVPHAHIHLVPINNVEDINFSRPKLNPSKDDLANTAKAIRENLI